MTDPTDWSARIVARVESNMNGGELFAGYVVRLYDRGAKDPEATIHDSEHAHGKAGVFATEDEAEDYRDRRLAASVADHQARDLMVAGRGPACARLEADRWALIAKLETERKAIAAQIKAAQGEIQLLNREATDPETLVECAPRGASWVVMAAQSLVDGTLGGAPRIVARAERRRAPERVGTTGALDQALADTETRTSKGGRKRPPPRATKAADHPPPVDAAGAPLAIGSEVELPGLKPVVRGKITAIGDWDPEAEAGVGAWIVIVEGEDGEILRPLATECLRLEPEQDGDQWPDEAA